MHTSVDADTDAILERFGSGERGEAVIALAVQGTHALPILEALFGGTARNRFGVPYRSTGQALASGLVAAQRLGPLARLLESRLRAELPHLYAIGALGALGQLADESIQALVKLVHEDASWDTLGETIQALARCGALERVEVQSAIAASPRAAWSLQRSRDLGGLTK